MSENRFIKPKDIADLLKLNPLTVYDYIKEGKIRAVKLGRSYRIKEKDLELFIRRHTVKPKEK